LATNRLEDGGRKKEEESKRRNIIRDYLNEMGYGLIEIDRDDISISLPANPKKTPKSEYDYCEVASKGLLYLATAKVLKEVLKEMLKERRFERALKVSSLWIGIDANISYCGFTRGSYAVFGVYAWGSSSVKQLLEFILNKESLVEDLAKAGYRVYVESYLTAMGRVIGYVRHLDETLSMSTVEAIHKIMKKKNKLSMIKGWGMGLGIYKPLWEAFFMPSYPTALQMINRTMDELTHFHDLVASSLREKPS